MHRLFLTPREKEIFTRLLKKESTEQIANNANFGFNNKKLDRTGS